MSAHPARHLQDALHHTRLVPAGSSAATPASCDLLALQRLFMMSPPPPLPPHPPPPLQRSSPTLSAARSSGLAANRCLMRALGRLRHGGG